MNIRKAVIQAILAARAGWDRKGFLHHTHVMHTSPKWSAL